MELCSRRDILYRTQHRNQSDWSILKPMNLTYSLTQNWGIVYITVLEIYFSNAVISMAYPFLRPKTYLNLFVSIT